MNLRQFLIICFATTIVTLSACVYRLDIPQGNRISDSNLSQLQVGMTKKQVEFLLGTPAIIDTFHPDDWYYINYLKKGSDGSVEKQVMTLRFNEDRLAEIEGSLNP